MKVRIEQERIPPGEDPQFHLKLGRGSLSDVEFTVQLLQLLHGGDHESLRTPETMSALEALVAVGLLAGGDADALRESFEFCSAARNARFLVTGSERESLPTDLAEAEHVARLLGYVDRPQASLRDDYRRVTRHARQVVERVFYGRESAQRRGLSLQISGGRQQDRDRLGALQRSTLRPAPEASGPGSHHQEEAPWVAGCSSSASA